MLCCHWNRRAVEVHNLRTRVQEVYLFHTFKPFHLFNTLARYVYRLLARKLPPMQRILMRCIQRILPQSAMMKLEMYRNK
jgi:hypothetical protein